MTLTAKHPSALIRPFAPEDYEAFVGLHNAVEREHPSTVEEMRHRDDSRDPKGKFARFVALMDGTIVAWGAYGQDASMYHPQKFWVGLGVHPEHRRQGIGGALYDRLMAALAPFSPLLLRAYAREDRLDALAFLAARGFAEESRAWESRLNPQRFDPSPYGELDGKMHALGVRIETLAELPYDTPESRRKLFDLDWEVSQDEPAPEPQTEPDYETWVKNTFETPNFMPQAYLVAVAGDAYVGMSTLWNSQSGDGLYNGMTGVIRPYRRHGVALAMKVRNLLWAKANGYNLIKTWNNTVNRPMLSINERLGFVKQPADIGFKKIIHEENV